MKYPKGQVHSDRDVDGDSSQQCNITLVKRKNGEWDVPHHSKNASTQYMTHVHVMRLKQRKS